MHIHFCCCSIAKACLILCNCMDCSTPGVPVLHMYINIHTCIYTQMYTHKHTCIHTYIYSRPLANRGIDLSITFSWSTSPEFISQSRHENLESLRNLCKVLFCSTHIVPTPLPPSGTPSPLILIPFLFYYTFMALQKYCNLPLMVSYFLN